MSYLNVPRIHFLGQFLASPSTINNSLDNFNMNQSIPPGGQFWNPTGVALFGFNGKNVNGTQLTPCLVTSVMDSYGNLATSGDPIIGAQIQTGTSPAVAKIVDLDPDQQQVTELFGVQLSLAFGSANAGFSMRAGEFLDVPSLADLWFVRAIAAQPGDGTASGVFQTVIRPEQIQWNNADASPLLAQFMKACQYGISLKFTTDAYDGASQSPTFNIGRVAGAMGPAQPGEPQHFVAGRRLIPQQSPLAQNMPPPPTFWTADAIIDETRKQPTLVIDLSNCYQIVGPAGQSANLGAMTAVIMSGGQPAPLSPNLDYSQNQYNLTAGIVEVPLTAVQRALLQSNPLGIVTAATGSATVMQESGDPYVRLSDTYLRMSPGETQNLDVIAVQFGKPVPNLTVEFEFITPVFLNTAFPQYPGLSGQLTPAINEPRTGIALQRLPGSGALGSVTTGPYGRATLAITANTPQPLPARRQFVDSQVYFIGGRWQSAGYLWWANNFAPLSVLVWDSYQIPEAPTWGTDVQPVMVEYMRMYPGMRKILDLTDYAVVSQNAQGLKQVFTAPINDPTHMPVTRDLSPAKTKMVLKWIANGLPQ